MTTWYLALRSVGHSPYAARSIARRMVAAGYAADTVRRLVGADWRYLLRTAVPGK